MDVDGGITRQVVAELADRFHEGHGLDVAHRAADLADDEIIVVIAFGDEGLDLVRDVRNDLHGGAEIVAAPFLVDDVLVDAAGGDVVGLGRRAPGEALVWPRSRSVSAPSSVTKTSRAGRAHRAGIDVEVGRACGAGPGSRGPAREPRERRRQCPCQGKETTPPVMKTYRAMGVTGYRFRPFPPPPKSRPPRLSTGKSEGGWRNGLHKRKPAEDNFRRRFRSSRAYGRWGRPSHWWPGRCWCRCRRRRRCWTRRGVAGAVVDGVVAAPSVAPAAGACVPVSGVVVDGRRRGGRSGRRRGRGRLAVGGRSRRRAAERIENAVAVRRRARDAVENVRSARLEAGEDAHAEREPKNSTARIAVVRVSALAVPRADMKPEPADAKTTALGALDEHDADQRDHDHEIDDEQDGLHVLRFPALWAIIHVRRVHIPMRRPFQALMRQALMRRARPLCSVQGWSVSTPVQSPRSGLHMRHRWRGSRPPPSSSRRRSARRRHWRRPSARPRWKA